MSTEQTTMTDVHDLGDGLILRWSTPADLDKIGQLLGTAFRSSDDDPLNIRMADQPHIGNRPDFPHRGETGWGVVEDTSKPERPIVACTCLWRHQWSYAGIPFGVGRPEFVASDPTYRNRGLVRKIFALLHARSAAEGHLLQGITGIPYFYRQFGYEYVLNLGGWRMTYLSLIPEKKGDEPEPYALRPATFEDISHLTALYGQGRKTSLLWHEATETYWRYLIGFWQDPAIQSRDIATVGMGLCLQMVVDTAGAVCGYVAVSARRGDRDLYVRDLYLYPQVSLPKALPVLLRLLRDYGLALPLLKPDTPPMSEILFNLGASHPLYDLLGEELAPRRETPYAWYIRVPDVPAFIRQIAPVLEERLAASALAGYTGELKLDFYRGGLRIELADGKLTTVETWRPPTYGDHANAGFPPLVFLQLLLSYRSLATLRTTYPDVWANNEATLLLNILFPLLPSTVNPL
ncbi:MAG: GNAT family N-acetyltransferase [Caldilineaceae bacterium]|nr:GNAT family N-acetyltransferase [Caldilineaceae bacterium]